MGNIAIYGGSFDPPHKGHLLLAKNLAKECNADKVLVMENGTVYNNANTEEIFQDA